MMRHIGILIRKLKEQHPTFYILDKESGKILAAASRTDISRGSLIAYSMGQKGNNSYIHSIDVLDLPDITHKDDLMFFHQVLEIAYYFLPLGKAVPDIFQLLLYLYPSIERINTPARKKLFLFKLFSHLGFYPEEQTTYIPLFNMIRMESIDVIFDKSVDLSLERKLDSWLDYCISMHPCTKYFKAISLFMSRKP